jgi:hypothetical protein
MKMEHLKVRKYKQRKIKLLTNLLEQQAREHWGSTKFSSFKKRFLKFDVHGERKSGRAYVGIWKDGGVHVYFVDANGALWNEYDHQAYSPKRQIGERVKIYFGYDGDPEIAWLSERGFGPFFCSLPNVTPAA